MSSVKQDFVKFDQVDKSYDGKVLVVKGLDLDIAEGEFLTLLGPSGSVDRGRECDQIHRVVGVSSRGSSEFLTNAAG